MWAEAIAGFFKFLTQIIDRVTAHDNEIAVIKSRLDAHDKKLETAN